MERLVELYDPHPGFGGAMISLPDKIKSLIDTLNGQQMTLNEATRQIDTILFVDGKRIGELEVAASFKGILLYIPNKKISAGQPIHCWRLLSYRSV